MNENFRLDAAIPEWDDRNTAKRKTMDEMTLGNDDIIHGYNEECFDTATTDKLGNYVYVLCDPRDRKVFYVGKAGGREAQGNNRIFNHFGKARDALKNNTDDIDQKTRRIIEIWSADEQVNWYIVRYGLPDEETTLHVEAALIDLLCASQNGPLLNLVRGHGASQHGMLTPDMAREFGAKPVAPTRNYPVVFIFPVQNAIASGEDIYEATRKAWSVSKDLRSKQDAVAVGVANGIAKGVFKINSWQEHGLHQPEVESGKDKDNAATPQSGKIRSAQLWGFIGEKLENSELLGSDFRTVITSAMGYWQRGNYLVVEVVNLGGKMCFRFLRGNRDKKTPIEF